MASIDSDPVYIGAALSSAMHRAGLSTSTVAKAIGLAESTTAVILARPHYEPTLVVGRACRRAIRTINKLADEGILPLPEHTAPANAIELLARAIYG